MFISSAKSRYALAQRLHAKRLTYLQVDLPLNKMFSRTYSEYCLQAWIPYLPKDIQYFETVQSILCRIIDAIQNLSYLNDFFATIFLVFLYISWLISSCVKFWWTSMQDIHVRWCLKRRHSNSWANTLFDVTLGSYGTQNEKWVECW